MGRKQRVGRHRSQDREANRDLALLLVVFVLGIMISIALATFARIVFLVRRGRPLRARIQ